MTFLGNRVMEQNENKLLHSHSKKGGILGILKIFGFVLLDQLRGGKGVKMFFA